MKRVVALLLACCLIVSTLSVSVFAADDSIIGKQWSCSTTGKSSGDADSGSSSTGTYSPLSYDDYVFDIPSSSYRLTYDNFAGLKIVDSSANVWTLKKHPFGTAYYIYKNGENTKSLVFSQSSGQTMISFDFLISKSGSLTAVVCYLASDGKTYRSSTNMNNSPWYLTGEKIVSMSYVTDDASDSSDSFSYVFDSSLSMNGFGSSPIEAIYDSFPGWSSLSRNVSDLYEIPAGTSIYVDAETVLYVPQDDLVRLHLLQRSHCLLLIIVVTLAVLDGHPQRFHRR